MSWPRLFPYVDVPPPRWAVTTADVAGNDSDPEESASASTSNLSPRKRRRVDSPLSETDLALAKKANDGLNVRQTPRSSYTSKTTRSSTVVADPTPSSSRSMSGTTVASTRPTHVKYEPRGDEFEETDDIEIPGEEPLSDDEDGDDDFNESSSKRSTTNDVPVRWLDDFSIYDSANEWSSIRLLFNLAAASTGKKGKRKRPDETEYFATGLVKAQELDDADDVDQDSILDSADQEEKESAAVRMRIGPIRQLNVHHWDKDSQQLDPLIYIMTDKAWYILDRPSDFYADLYIEFLVPHQVTHLLLVQALSNAQLDLETFRSKLDDNEIQFEDRAYQILERTLQSSDLDNDDAKIYALSTIPDLVAKMHSGLAKHPLLLGYFGEADVPLEVPPSDDETDDSMSDNGVPVKKKKIEGSDPFVTPTVAAICQAVFRVNFTVSSKSDTVAENVRVLREKIVSHENDPESILWGNQIDETSYESVTIDGQVYRPGDVVIVLPDRDARPCSSTNNLARNYWFTIIRSLYEDNKGHKKFHGQWFEHGSRTFLQQLAHSKELFLLDSCGDHLLATIVQRVNVEFLRDPLATMPPDDLEDKDCTEFLCLYRHDPKRQVFFELLTEAEEAELLNTSSCVSCALTEHWEAMHLFSFDSDGSFIISGDRYHLFDFVYLANTSGLVLDIAQITKMPTTDQPRLEIRYLDRVCDLEEGDTYVAQERRLAFSKQVKTLQPDRLKGKCYVRQLLDGKDHDEIVSWTEGSADHFYTNEVQGDKNASKSFRHCAICLQDQAQTIDARAHARKTVSPLHCMELFAGAGGLGTGLKMSGHIDPKWAIEYMPSAAKTYQHNHPETSVYCQDVGRLLRHTIQRDKSEKELPKLVSLGGNKKTLPDMPQRGEVDILSGGPPCQAFSRANYRPNADDLRATLPMTMLSFVEYYNPRYFILENVVGMLQYRLLARPKSHGRSLEGGITMGMMKLICRILMSLGYNVAFKLLQAGHYGAPQDRRRVIILGSRRGIPLPEFPIPTHAFPKMPRYKCPGVIDTETNKTLRVEPATRSKDPDEPHGCAPLKPVFVNDAISDLAKFDWQSDEDKKLSLEDRQRKGQGIAQFLAVTRSRVDNPVVGYERVQYDTPPQTSYQKTLRAGNRTTVTHHQTRSYSSAVIQASLHVSLKPRANHRSVPQKYLPMRMHSDKKNVFYGRLDANDSFKTAMTTVAPNSKGSILLHPSQKRVVTVREAARAQGFPDDYEFLSIHKNNSRILIDQYKQIGNAVPVPLAIALGRSIEDAEMKCREKEAREGSPEL